LPIIALWEFGSMLPHIWLFQEKLKLYFYMKSSNLKMLEASQEVPMGFFSQPTGCQFITSALASIMATILG
jgi:hypothetical protein